MSLNLESVRLPDSAFWQSGVDRTLDPVIDKYKTSFFGVLVDAPRELPLPGHTTLPLFAYFMGSYKQLATRSFLHQALLVTVDPDRNVLRLSRAIQDDGERIDEPETDLPEDVPAGYLAEVHELDVRERTNLPWKQGRIISQVIVLDLPSNRVETKLNGGPSAFEDIEKEKFLAAERARLDPPAPFPVLPASAYVATPDSPPIPEESGLVLTAPRVAVTDGKAPILLHGSYRLSVAPEELVKPANAAYNREHGLIDPRTKEPYAAVLTIHLLVLASARKHPTQYRLQIPVAQLSGESPVGAGHFTLDLTRLPDFPQSEQTLFLYGYAKEVAAASPVTVGIIDRRPEE